MTREMTATARELVLWTENTFKVYEYLCYVHEMLDEKVESGIYDHEKARKAFMYVMEDGAKSYVKEFCDDKWFNVFPISDRREAAEYFLIEYEEERGI